MGPGLFWGILIILIGISLIFRELPIFRIVIGGLFIFWGISMLFGGFGKTARWYRHDSGSTIFSDFNFSGKEVNNEYNVVFGKGTFDFRNVDFSKGSKDIKINTVFGAAEILLNDSVPVRIRSNSAFGGIKLPNGNTTAFGSTEYSSDQFSTDSTYLNLELNVVFGGMEIH